LVAVPADTPVRPYNGFSPGNAANDDNRAIASRSSAGFRPA
jgi:hypothetical protein